MIYNCGFDFHVLICHLHIVFSEMSFHTICLFSPWIVSFLMLRFQSSFYILYANSWLAMWLTNIFSHSVVYLLILLTRSSIEQTFFILLKSRLSFFFFYGHALASLDISYLEKITVFLTGQGRQHRLWFSRSSSSNEKETNRHYSCVHQQGVCYLVKRTVVWFGFREGSNCYRDVACVTCGAKCPEPLHSLWEDADVRLQGLKCFNFIQSKNITTRVLLSRH